MKLMLYSLFKCIFYAINRKQYIKKTCWFPLFFSVPDYCYYFIFISFICSIFYYNLLKPQIQYYNVPPTYKLYYL